MGFKSIPVTLLVLISSTLASSPLPNQQPEAPCPPPVTHRPLPWGALNFLHTTDVHVSPNSASSDFQGWVEGHIKEPSYSADWGDVYSFVHHMKTKAHREGRDLLLVDTGDLHDGTGLSDTTPLDGEITDEIFKYVDYDVLSVGQESWMLRLLTGRNHELYVGEITKAVYQNFVPRYKGRYLTSNVNITVNGTSVPLGERYRKFTTPVNNFTILAFGILFDFTGNDKFVSTCQPVQFLVQESWFQSVLQHETSDVDLIIVAGHTPLRNTTGFEYPVVLNAIRQHLPDMPVQFFGGHSHIRDFRKYDDKAHGIESGRYLETLGWISMDLEPFKVGRRYIDNNIPGYKFHSGVLWKDFATQQGKSISAEIQKKRREQGLKKLLGCVPRDYYTSRAPFPSKNSIFTLITEEVFPKLVYNASYNPNRLSTSLPPSSYPRTFALTVVLLNSGGIRFDLLKGNFTLNDEKTVSPFKNAFVVLKDVAYRDAKIVLDWLNTGRFGYIVQDEGGCPCGNAWRPTVQQAFERGNQHIFSLDVATPGYVTYDDLGTDGDDTIHTPLPYYHIPFYIQSTLVPPTITDTDFVDLIFTNFSAPGVLEILNLYGSSGKGYDLDELELYQSDPITLTNMFERYVAVEDNWKIKENGRCD